VGCHSILRRLFSRTGRAREETGIQRVLIPTGFLIRDKHYTLLDLVVRNGKGVVARIMDVILSEDLSVANITTPGIVTSDMDRGRLFILVEDCDEACGKRLVDKLTSNLSDIILSAEHLSTFNSYIFPSNIELYFTDARALVFTTGLLREGFREMYRYVSTMPGLEEGFNNSLRNLGRGVGRHLFQRWNRRLEDAGGFEEYVEQGLRFFEAIYNAMGLGRPRASTEDYINYRVEINDNWECVILLEANLSKEPSITIGILEGYLSEMLGKRVVAKEEKHARSKGEACIFTAKTYEAITE